MRGIADSRRVLQFTFNHFIIFPLPNIIQILIEIKPTIPLLAILLPIPIIMTSIIIIKLPIAILLARKELSAIIRPISIEQIPDPCNRVNVHEPPKIAKMIIANDRK